MWALRLGVGGGGGERRGGRARKTRGVYGIYALAGLQNNLLLLYCCLCTRGLSLCPSRARSSLVVTAAAAVLEVGELGFVVVLCLCVRFVRSRERMGRFRVLDL